MSQPIRVTLVDDQTLVRQGIRSLLALSPEIEVVGEGGDGADAVRLARELSPDVVLLDLRMPGTDGIYALEQLRALGSTVPVLVLTTFDDDELVLRAVRAGARGYLLKDVTLEHLVAAIRSVAAGGTVLEPATTDRLVRAVVGGVGLSEPGPHAEPLSPRERDVLRLAAAGYSNREIADALHLAEGTVKNHMSSVLLKLGARDRTRAVLRALELGVLGTPD